MGGLDPDRAKREGAARRVLLSLDLLGKLHQVSLLLSLLEKNGSFTAPGLADGCGVPRGLVYPFIASLRAKGVVKLVPRPEEPAEWADVYGRGVLAKRRREHHITGAAPLEFDLERFKVLATEGGCDSDDLRLLVEASR